MKPTSREKSLKALETDGDLRSVCSPRIIDPFGGSNKTNTGKLSQQPSVVASAHVIRVETDKDIVGQLLRTKTNLDTVRTPLDPKTKVDLVAIPTARTNVRENVNETWPAEPLESPPEGKFHDVQEQEKVVRFVKPYKRNETTNVDLLKSRGLLPLDRFQVFKDQEDKTLKLPSLETGNTLVEPAPNQLNSLETRQMASQHAVLRTRKLLAATSGNKNLKQMRLGELTLVYGEKEDRTRRWYRMLYGDPQQRDIRKFLRSRLRRQYSHGNQQQQSMEMGNPHISSSAVISKDRSTVVRSFPSAKQVGDSHVTRQKHVSDASGLTPLLRRINPSGVQKENDIKRWLEDVRSEFEGISLERELSHIV